MNQSPELERRYRRLLAIYPEAYRREHEDEILAVLMAGARPGQRRPALEEVADLLRHALPMRIGSATPTRFERRHVGPVVVLRLGVALWLTALLLFFCGSGQWWGLAFLPVIALHLVLAYRVATVSARDRGAPPPSVPSR